MALNSGVDINENCFDIVRIVCAFIIFFGHFITHFHVDIPFMFDLAYFIRGVPVFFMLSGLFIASSLERYSTKEFLIRRFFRIYPALWVCLILNTLIIFLIYALPSLKDLLLYIVTQFTVAQFFTGDWLRGYGVGVPNGSLWMISCMVQFYILAVFIGKWMKHRSLKVWLMVIFLCAVPNLFLNECQSLFPPVVWSLLTVIIVPFLYIFLFGMMVCYHRDRVIPFFVRYRYVIWLAYIVWQLCVPSSVTVLFEGVRYNLVTTFLLLMSVTALGFSFGKHRLKADYSYSFYLYHMVVINVVYHLFIRHITSGLQFVGLLCLCTLLISVLAVLSQKFVERKIGNTLLKRALKGSH